MRTKSGRALNDRDIAALAREAEAGYDLTSATRRRVGRPSLSLGMSPRVLCRIEADVFEKAKKKADVRFIRLVSWIMSSTKSSGILVPWFVRTG